MQIIFLLLCTLCCEKTGLWGNEETMHFTASWEMLETKMCLCCWGIRKYALFDQRTSSATPLLAAWISDIYIFNTAWILKHVYLMKTLKACMDVWTTKTEHCWFIFQSLKSDSQNMRWDKEKSCSRQVSSVILYSQNTWELILIIYLITADADS